jgi:hypothetical protein
MMIPFGLWFSMDPYIHILHPVWCAIPSKKKMENGLFIMGDLPGWKLGFGSLWTPIYIFCTQCGVQYLVKKRWRMVSL